MNPPITQMYDELCEQLARLNYLITEAKPMVATVAVIPGKKPEEQHDHGPIVPEHFIAAAAAGKATEQYLDLHIKKGLCTKTARRTVGAMLYSPDITPLAGEIPACVEAINLSKLNLKEHLLNTYEERYERFEALRTECPGVMALHLYRQIRCMHNAEVTKVNFTWQRKISLVRPKTKPQLIKMIEKEVNVASPERAAGLIELIKAVMALPIDQIRLRRNVQPQPSANIWEAGRIRTVTAPMPILVVQNKPIDIKPLPDFDPAVPPTNRTADKLVTRQIGEVRGIIVEQIVL